MSRLRSVEMVLMLSLVAISHVAIGRDSTLAIKGEYPVTQVADSVYVIWGPIALPNKANPGFCSNPGFVVTSRGVVVIDPGISVHVGQMVLEKIRTITDAPVVAVFNSHIHGDHWLANGAIRNAFPEAVIYAHARMKDLAEAGEGEIWLKRFNEMTGGALEGTRPVSPDATVDSGSVLRFGDTTFRIHHPPRAHTDNDIMVEVVEKKVLFLGDVARGRALSRMVDGTFSGNIAAIDQAMGTGAEYFVPGHGPGGGREVPQAFQTYLETLYTTVRDLYEQDLSDFEMKPEMAEALAAYRDWFGFGEFLGPHVSQAYLEIEAPAF